MWSENSTEIQYSYTKPLELEAYLTPHSTLHTPRIPNPKEGQKKGGKNPAP
jgi:hypothetical protein